MIRTALVALWIISIILLLIVVPFILADSGFWIGMSAFMLVLLIVVILDNTDKDYYQSGEYYFTLFCIYWGYLMFIVAGYVRLMGLENIIHSLAGF